MLKKDLENIHCEMIFWNWNVSAAGVICRLEDKTKGEFYNGKTVNEVVEKFLRVKENYESA